MYIFAARLRKKKISLHGVVGASFARKVMGTSDGFRA
jgi:hypothetical protein